MGVSHNTLVILFLLFSLSSLASPRVCCARFSFSNTSRNPSFRSTVDKHQQGKNSTVMAAVSLFPPKTTEPNTTLLTCVLILIALMLALIIIFTIVHCAIFCGLTFKKIQKSMKKEEEVDRLPYFVLSDYSETSPLIHSKKSQRT